MSAREFALEIDEEFGEIVEKGLLRAVQTIAFELDERIKTKTPVDTGAAVGSWHASVGSVEFREKGTNVAIEAMTKPAVVYLTNAMEYISALERGHSSQAPNGMVAVSLVEVEIKYGRIE